MKLSRETQDGLTGLIFLAQKPEGAILQVSEVARDCSLAQPFLAKIFIRLARAGVLHSFRGQRRGYALGRSAGEISVKDVVQAIEGPDIFHRCVFWSTACTDANPCILHPVWQNVRPVMIEFLARTTIEDLAEGRQTIDLEGAPASVREGRGV
jgi:Rrf2 family iron-sulfur cluster assembly transcriptional regulator